MIVKGSSTEKRKHVVGKSIEDVLSLSTARQQHRDNRHMIVPSAMVKAADHIKGHVMLMNHIDVSVLLCMIG